MSTFAPMLFGFGLALTVRLGLIRFYSLWIKQGVFGDSAYHYCVVRSLSKRKGPYQGVPEFYLKNGPDRYPVLFHRFAGLFGLRTVEKHPHVPNLLLFVGFSTVFPLLILNYHAPGNPAWLSPMLAGQGLALLAVLLFVTSVANNSLRGDGVLFLSLSERLLSKLSVGLYFFSVLLWQTDGSVIFLIVSIVIGSVSMLTSMFGRQALIFTTPLWSLMNANAEILAVLLGVILLSTLLGGSNFLLALRDQWDFSASYRSHTSKSRVFRDSLSKFSTFTNSDTLGDSLRQIINYEPGKSLSRHPDLLLVGVIGGSKLPAVVLTLLLATVVVYLLTTMKAFRHFGESERYIDYNLAFVLPFTVASVIWSQPSAYSAIVVLVLALLYRLALIAIFLWADAGRSIDGHESLNEILRQANVTKESRVLPLPINFGQTISARTGCGVVCYPGVYGVWLFERYIDEYPLFKRPLESLVSEFGISHIFLNKPQTERFAEIVGWSYDLNAYQIVAENEHWCCYHV